MITKEEAIRIAEEHENHSRYGQYTGGEKRVVDDEWTIERDYGWLFIVNTADYVRTRDRRYALVGNGPILVLRDDGSLIEFFSSYDREEALAEYEAHPDKFVRQEASQLPQAGEIGAATGAVVVTKQEAIRIAENYVNSRGPGSFTRDDRRFVDDEWTIEREYGWMFMLNTADYIRTRDRHHAFIGNAPVLVLRDGGSVIDFPSSYHLDRAVAEYESRPEMFARHEES